MSDPKVIVFDVGLTDGHVLCRHCDVDWYHGSAEDRRKTMRLVRKHLKEHPTHILDFEDSYQTTVNVEGVDET